MMIPRMLLYGMLSCFVCDLVADDWRRFRGPGGSGVAVDSSGLPDEWSASTNVAWKRKLPGPGASSPIIVGDRVFVTCYSGYGVTQEQTSELESLVRHLLCFRLSSGELLWQRDVKARLPEDPYYQSGVSSHGYATHTPCSDGEAVYCFFGKGGVVAFDLAGDRLWQAEVGTQSDPVKWGSSSSPVIAGDLLIVTAAAEDRAIIGFDKRSGREIWRYESEVLAGMWGTPALVRVSEQRQDLVMLVPGELWGLNPTTGKLLWSVEDTGTRQAYTSIVFDAQRVYALAGQGAGSVAVQVSASAGGGTRPADWKSGVTATYATPVLYGQRLYVISRGVLAVVDAETGERLQQQRLAGTRVIGNKRWGALNYASPVIAGDRLIFLNAAGQVDVFALEDKLRRIAVNDMVPPDSEMNEVFWGSPAISQGRLLIRSSHSLYCIGTPELARADGGNTSGGSPTN